MLMTTIIVYCGNLNEEEKREYNDDDNDDQRYDDVDAPWSRAKSVMSGKGKRL